MTPTAWIGLGSRRQWTEAGIVLAVVEALVVWRIGPTAALPAFAYLGAAGTLVSLVDLHTRRLPNRVVLPSYFATFALLTVASGVQGRWWPLGRAVIAATLVAGFYLALGLVFPHGLGLGDVKLGGLLALGLGWWGWPTLTTGVLAGWGLATVALLGRYATGPTTRGQPIALGPWLCLGALAAILAR
jgi:leader peptidase (prepilin peptidase)/N-methyltransferase